MSKSKNQLNTPNINTTSVETTTENVSKSEIVTTDNTPIAAPINDLSGTTTIETQEVFNWQAYKEEHPKSMVHLYPQVPHLLKKLKRYEKPDETDLQTAMTKLNAKERSQFEDLLENMNPDKDGVELGATGIRPKLIKLFQGTGSDPLRHDDCPIGGFYVQGDRILTAPDQTCPR
jgi:hypothetical protein